MSRKRCKICKRGYGYYGDIICVHIGQDKPWDEIKDILEEYELCEVCRMPKDEPHDCREWYFGVNR